MKLDQLVHSFLVLLLLQHHLWGGVLWGAVKALTVCMQYLLLLQALQKLLWEQKLIARMTSCKMHKHHTHNTLRVVLLPATAVNTSYAKFQPVSPPNRPHQFRQHRPQKSWQLSRLSMHRNKLQQWQLQRRHSKQWQLQLQHHKTWQLSRLQRHRLTQTQTCHLQPLLARCLSTKMVPTGGPHIVHDRLYIYGCFWK